MASEQRRLRRRNAIRKSAYVPSPDLLSPASDQPTFSWEHVPTLVLEDGDLGEEVEVGEVEGGVESALTEESTSSTAAVSANEIVVKRNIENWRTLELVGTGSFGRVYKAISEDGFVFAVKEASLIGPESYAKQSTSQLEQETLLLSYLEHKNIVQYFGAKKEETVLCIFLEFVREGSLVSLYEKHHLEESRVSAYTRQILNGLNYLHHQNVLHRDIKCANILIDANGTVKLADFGLAKEIVRGNPYGSSADIWSIGCTVLEMLTQKFPYPGENWVSVFYKIGCGELPPIPCSLSQEARDLIDKCLRINPDDRPSADELLKHPFVMISEPD